MSSTNTKIRRRLAELREELENVTAIGAANSSVVELDQSKVGRLSRMDAMQAQAMAQASNQRREAALQRIHAALIRLDNDEFGICQLCGEQINSKRLDFDPTVLYCVDCAKKREAQ